jgi:hypothetical protein
MIGCGDGCGASGTDRLTNSRVGGESPSTSFLNETVRVKMLARRFAAADARRIVWFSSAPWVP